MLYIKERRETSLDRKGSFGGVVLVLVGLFWLLTNFGIVNWSLIDVMLRLWPLILITIGINVIFRDKVIIRYITWGLFFIIIISFGFYNQYRFGNGEFVNSDPNMTIESRTETTMGKLNLQLGGGSVEINSTDKALINATIPNNRVWKDVRFSNGNKRADIDIKQKSNFVHFGGNQSYDYDFSLDDKLLWDIDIDTGAINGTMDFSNLMLSKLDIDMGASNLNLIFGDKSEKTKVDIDGGVTNLEITVPKDIGVRIDIDGGIKNTNIRGIGWKKIDGSYISPNYDEAAKKLEIDVDMGIGKFDINVK